MRRASGVATNDLVERLAALPLGDVGLAVLFTALIELEIWLFRPDTSYPVVASVAALAVGMALAFRRVWPFRSLLVNLAGIFVLVALGNPSNFIQWTSLITVWSIAAYGRRVQQWAGLGLALAGVAFYFVRIPGQGGVTVFIATAAVWTIVWLVSLLFGARIREEGLREAGSVAEALAMAQRERLQFEEARTSMARDLHDLIGHTVNLMLVHAEGGRLALDDDPAATRLALDTIVATAR
ncbi:MAG: histidine kinase, partial [bacterium]|nr:histidine kinase [bacterium]